MASERMGIERDEDRSAPVLTTRPRRLLLIGRVQPGHETDVLEAHERLPYAVTGTAGIDAVEAFVGSGYYALLLEIDTDDAQEALASFLNDANVQEFYASLQPFVTGLPGPEWQYAPSDTFHEEAGSAGGAPRAADAGATYSSADLPLAASMYRWRREGLSERR